MPTWAAEDIAAFFEGDLTDAASFSHEGGEAANIMVKFSNDYLALLGVESSGPSAKCKSSDVSTAAHGDTLTINSTAYNITGIQPDGTGFTLLILSRD